MTVEVTWRGEPGYEERRTGPMFNARHPERYPAGVVRARGPADVAAAVRLAGARDLPVALRSGGHSWAGWGLRDGALLIDLGGLKDIAYDEDSGIVSAGPAVTGEELNAALAPYGRFFPGGHCPTVGLGGFLLQGGMGWNTRGWGWACERIAALDVVTADGEPRRVDDGDLLWAARGAGPGYPAAVTRFHLRTRPLPPVMAHTTLVLPPDAFAAAYAWFAEIQPKVAHSVELVLLGMRRDDPVVVLRGTCFADGWDEARTALDPLLTCPVIDRALERAVCAPTSLAEEYAEQIRENPPGHRYAADDAWVSAPAGAAAPALEPLFTALPTPSSYTLLYGMGPARDRPDMALSLETGLYLASYVNWAGPAEDALRTWPADQMRRIEPLTSGLFLADCDLSVREAPFMAAANRDRLERIRTEWDPAGRFCSYHFRAT